MTASPRTLVVDGLPVLPEHWHRWAIALALPATLIGVFLYPDIHLGVMPLSAALAIILVVAGGLVLGGQLRLLVLLPLVASFLPSLQIGFAAYLIAIVYFLADYGGERLVRPLDEVDWALLAMLLWTVMSWLVNLGTQTDLWSLPVFAVTFLSPWLLLFLARAAPWTDHELRTIIGVWLALVVAQIAPALIKPLVMRTPESYEVPLVIFQISKLSLLRDLVVGDASDLTFGTTSSAHHLGSAMLLGIVLVASLAVARGRRAVSWLLAAMIFVFMMTDSKHLILAALPAGLIWFRLVAWPELTRTARRWISVLGIGLGVTAGPYMAVQTAKVVIEDVWQPYIALATINPKAQLFIRTAGLLARNDLNTWVGFGPGSFATRAATIRATNVLFKEENRLPAFIPAYTGPAYRSVAYDLYTSQVAETVRFRSGALTNPFSSLAGIVAEYGIGGTMVVAFFLWRVTRMGYRRWRDTSLAATWRAAGATVGFGIPYLVLLGIFDSYFEQPDVTAPLILLAIVALVAPDRRPASGSAAEGGAELLVPGGVESTR